MINFVILFNYFLFIILFVCILVECNRVPFDLTEAESELVAGFMTEFSSIYFSVIMLSEYLSIIIFSLLLILLFSSYFSFFIFIISLICLLRASLNRLKYDELLSFGWYFILIILFSLFILLLCSCCFRFTSWCSFYIKYLVDSVEWF
jgi:NADH-quinone oxidoreductase subunit H